MVDEVKILKAVLQSLSEIVTERQKKVKSKDCEKQFSEKEIEEIKLVTMGIAAWKPILRKAIKILQKDD